MTRAADIVSSLHAHPLAARPRPVPVRNTWQAFLSLWRHGGEPALRDERGLRWTAAGASLGLHLGFVALLLWFAMVQLPPPPEEAGEGARIRIEFVGRGTPDAAEDGLPAAIPEPAASSAASSAQARPAPAPPERVITPPDIASPTPSVAQREVPEPTPAAAQQPLQVTETPQPTVDFVLPPPTPRVTEIVPRNIEAPELAVPSREVVVPVRPNAPALPTPAVATPDVVRETALRTRDVPVPPQPSVVHTPEVPLQTRPARQIATEVPDVARRDVPTPPAPVSQPEPAASQVPAASVAETAQPARASDRPAQTAPTTAAPGARTATSSAPLRDDDWGGAERNVTGNERGGPGLLDSDGRARLPPGAVAGDPGAQRGAPGGQNDQWTRERFEQAGTWLQRPPYDYAPTRFDQYWVPSESLLAEWVRRNVREMEIPIPGTSLRLSCVISVLQFGGGCGLVNSNIQHNPATARPPPDIPFKPELQEGNGALPPNIEPPTNQPEP